MDDEYYAEDKYDLDSDDLVGMAMDYIDSESIKLKDVKAIVESKVNEAEVKSDEEFNEYATTVLQKAFGEEFDEAKAKKVIDGILAKSKGDYGVAVGMLTSSLG